MKNPQMEAAIRADIDILDIRRVYYDNDRKNHYIEVKLKPYMLPLAVAGSDRHSNIAHLWISEREFRGLCGLVQLMTRHGDKAWTKEVRIAHLETLSIVFSPSDGYATDSASQASRVRERFETFVQHDWKEPTTEEGALIFDARDWGCGFGVTGHEVIMFVNTRVSAKGASGCAGVVKKLEEVANSSFMPVDNIGLNVYWADGQLSLGELNKGELLELVAVLRMTYGGK